MSWEFSADKPIYAQLVDAIEMRIISGAYPPGTKLVSIREMAAKTGVNPNTMQKSLAELERKGLIITNRTNGKYITEDIELVCQIKNNKAKDQVKQLFKHLHQLGFNHQESIQLITNTMEEE